MALALVMRVPPRDPPALAERLSPDLRLTFAAACAQRLQSGYEEYARRALKRPMSEAARRMVSQSSRLAATAMDEVWSGLLTGRWNRRRIESLARKCVQAIPAQDEFVPARHRYLEDVASAIAYALTSCLTKAAEDVSRVAWAAYETAAQIVIRREDVRYLTPAVEQRLLSDSVVQLELQRQVRDLADLAASDPREARARRVALRLRERARAEAWTLP